MMWLCLNMFCLFEYVFYWFLLCMLYHVAAAIRCSSLIHCTLLITALSAQQSLQWMLCHQACCLLPPYCCNWKHNVNRRLARIQSLRTTIIWSPPPKTSYIFYSQTTRMASLWVLECLRKTYGCSWQLQPLPKFLTNLRFGHSASGSISISTHAGHEWSWHVMTWMTSCKPI